MMAVGQVGFVESESRCRVRGIWVVAEVGARRCRLSMGIDVEVLERMSSTT